MPLTPGTRIGEYEVLAMLGTGGMGEVYRARDTRLFRDVALKLLPSDKTREPVLLWRLRTEARIVAKLNHTNIAGLYDIQVHDDSPVLVMELVEGQRSPFAPTPRAA